MSAEKPANYEAWRITYQSSEAAARAAFSACVTLRAALAIAERQRDEARERLDKLEAAGAWQPIETAPKDGTWVHTVGKNGAGFWTVPQTVRWTGLWESPVHDARVEVYHQPTHWMPLPPLPPAPQQGGG